jgi:2,4-dienoyl-CoA reductase-like NADH-dependent reductase (Old Yellow Enzyme family)/thioredoxin reductase
MKHLFSPFQIRGRALQNRIVMPALASFLIENDGTITEKTIEHYRLRAAGGPGMVIVEACAVSPEGVVSPHQARIDDDRFVEGLSKIAAVIRAEGAVPAIQIHHGGRQTSVKVIKQKPLAPSPLPCPAIRGDVEPLTVEGIERLVMKFGEAASRAMDAGFDLIEIHGAHGYLINQFLSRFSNIREDAYGGDTTGRARFAKEVLEEVRRRVGDEVPISFKISAQEFVPHGLTVKESIRILEILTSAGMDIVQVSAGNDATPEWIAQPMFMDQGCLVNSAYEIKKALGLPVMAVGRINHPVLANDIIASGKADLVCIGRGLIADPEMPRKAKEGRLDELRTCLACNTCMESIFRRGRVECLVNPSLGREKEMVLRPSSRPKKIMVIGAGPAGLDVAWVAAKRGHTVHLYEKGSDVGGQLALGSLASYKKEFLNLIRFQMRQVEKWNVTCHLNQEVDLGTVKALNPDAVVLASGSVPSYPPVEGIDGPLVISLAQALDCAAPPIGRIAIVGGGPTGSEAAYHLSEQGCEVTLIEMRPKIALGVESMTRKLLIRALKEKQVKIMTECTLLKVEEGGLLVRHREGKELRVPCDRVLITTGNRPDDALYEEITSAGYEVHRIGDCLDPRSAKEAIYEAAVLGRAL